MSNSAGLSPKNPTIYKGPNVYIAEIVTRNRAPTGADYRQPETGKLYPFGTYWLVGKNPTTGTYGDLWYLSNIVANVGNWLKLSTGSSGPLISIAVPAGSSPVVPTVAGLITFTSTSGTITITGSTNSINFDLEGGTEAIDSIGVDAHTAPGTSPVIPSSLGLVTFTGSQVAPGTIGANVLRSNSLAANTVTYEIQQTSAVSSKDTTKNGVAHFKSSQFTNDQGFISYIPQTFSVVIQTFTSSGTYTPTSGMKYCQVEMVGGGGAGGGAPTSGVGTNAVGGQGGGGEYARGIFSAATIGVSQTVTIGAGGTGTSGAQGNSGGTTSLGSLITALGGSGGGISSVGSAGDAGGGLGGTGGTGGSLRFPGTRGAIFFYNAAIGQITNSAGGNSYFGVGSYVGSANVNGIIGLGYGSGGSGTGTQNSSAVTGGPGAPGTIVITEWVIA